MNFLVVGVVVVLLAVGAGYVFLDDESKYEYGREDKTMEEKMEDGDYSDGDDDHDGAMMDKDGDDKMTEEVMENKEEESTDQSNQDDSSVEEEQVSEEPAAQSSVFADGSYSQGMDYSVPSGDSESITVTLTVAGDVVTDAELQTVANHNTSKGFQANFAAAYESQVVGKNIDEIVLSRVGGASLTSTAFNKAVTAIKAQARN